MDERPSEQGFTLVEVLAALAVFSIAAIGLSQASSETVSGANHAEAKALAEIVAENQLAEALIISGELPIGARTGEAVQRGRLFSWTRLIDVSTRPDLQTISLTVEDMETGQVLVRLQTLKRTTP